MPTFQPPPVVALIGPSACGKSSVVGRLHRRGLVRVNPTWTTRPRRPEEADGCLEHRFVSDADFTRLAAAGFFLDTARLPGLPHRYGLARLPSPSAGPVDVVVMRAPLVPRLAARVPRLVVYQITDDIDVARRRLRARGCAGTEIAARLADHDRELRRGRPYADRSFANDGPLADLVDAVATALAADLGAPACRLGTAVAS